MLVENLTVREVYHLISEQFALQHIPNMNLSAKQLEELNRLLLEHTNGSVSIDSMLVDKTVFRLRAGVGPYDWGMILLLIYLFWLNYQNQNSQGLPAGGVYRWGNPSSTGRPPTGRFDQSVPRPVSRFEHNIAHETRKVSLNMVDQDGNLLGVEEAGKLMLESYPGSLSVTDDYFICVN